MVVVWFVVYVEKFLEMETILYTEETGKQVDGIIRLVGKVCS